MKSPQHMQKGYALLALISIVATSSMVALVSNVKSATKISEQQRQRTTIRALASAKQALIYKAILEDNTPGSMLCPDLDVDGKSEGSCNAQSVEAPNRLPFKTLGISIPVDDSGECLWYAISADFRSFIGAEDRSTTKTHQRPINPGNLGSLTLLNQASNTRTSVVAVLIAPRESLNYQNRNAISRSGCRTGTSLSFLESYDTSKKHYILGTRNVETLNDGVLSITAEDVMRPLMRVVLGHFTSQRTAEALLQKMPDSSATLDSVRNLDPKNFDEALFGPVEASEINSSCYKNRINGYRTPVSWLCFNDWYRHIHFNKAQRSLSITLNEGKPSAYRCSVFLNPAVLNTAVLNTGRRSPITCNSES